MKKLALSMQASETLALGIFLTLAGGFQDAYSYNCRGHVFANAQTGNIVLLGQNLAQGNWGAVLRYLIPILAFLAGVYVTEWIRHLFQDRQQLHWRQIVVLIQTASLGAVGFFPQEWNMAANLLLSFSCAMQVDSFRKIRGLPCATTMCIGNMRSGTELLSRYHITKDPTLLEKGTALLPYHSGVCQRRRHRCDGHSLFRRKSHLDCCFLAADWIFHHVFKGKEGRNGRNIMKLCTTTGALESYTASAPETVRCFEGTGFRLLDFNFYRVRQKNSPFLSEEWKEWIQSICAAGDQLGVSFVQAHSPDGNCMADPEERKQLIFATNRCIHACALMGIPNLVVHPGTAEGAGYDRFLTENSAYFQALYPAMEEYGSTCSLKTAPNRICPTARSFLPDRR